MEVEESNRALQGSVASLQTRNDTARREADKEIRRLKGDNASLSETVRNLKEENAKLWPGMFAPSPPALALRVRARGRSLRHQHPQRTRVICVST